MNRDREGRSSPFSGPHQSRGILVLAIWFGLLTGFGEVVLLGIKRFYMGQILRLGPDVVWMTPLADVALFLVPGLILFVLARRSHGVSPWIVTLVFSFGAYLSALLLYHPLHLYAKIVLAAGLAVQTARVIARSPGPFQAVVRQSVVWMAALLVVFGVGMRTWSGMTFRQELAGLPPSRPGTPNVLLIVLDTVRADNMSLYGYNRQTTPNLERWARTSTVFDNATSTAPWTLPSHASMFTGRWPHEQSSGWEAPFDGRHLTLSEALSSHGYITAGFVANNQYCSYEFGLNRGFAHYEDYVASPQETLISSALGRTLVTNSAFRRVVGYYDTVTRKDAQTVNDRFLGWLARVDGRPFFAFLNYFDAHETYLPPAPFAGRFGPGVPRGVEHVMHDLRRSMRTDWHMRPPEEIKTEMDMYDGAIAYIDHELDRLFKELQTRGLLDTTIVIVTSDHGEQFGEHGLFLHSNSLYEPLLHVPLMISYPGQVPGGRRVAARASLRDLPATVVDLIGLQGQVRFPGKSLARYWSAGMPSDSPTTEAVLSEVGYSDWAEKWHPTAKGDMQSLMDDRYHYIRNGDGREELYVLGGDPGERHDISDSEAGRRVLERFRAELKGVLAVDHVSRIRPSTSDLKRR